MPHGYGEVEALHDSAAHIDHTDHLALTIEQRPAGVARIDRRIDLQKKFAFEEPAGMAENTLRHGAFQTGGIADHEYIFTVDRCVRPQNDGWEGAGMGVFDLQHRQIVEGIQGHDTDVLVDHPFEFGPGLDELGDSEMFLPFNDVEIGDQITLGVYEEAGSQTSGRFDHHHGRAEGLDALCRGMDPWIAERIKIMGRGGRR